MLVKYALRDEAWHIAGFAPTSIDVSTFCRFLRSQLGSAVIVSRFTRRLPQEQLGDRPFGTD